MAYKFTTKVEGLGELQKRLLMLPFALQQKGARTAARKAMNIVRNTAKATARGFDDPETREMVYKNMSTQYSTRGSKAIGGVKMRVGVRGGARFDKGVAGKASSNPGGYTWYWRFLEWGTVNMRSPAPYWLTSALESNVSAVVATLSAELDAEITKAAANVSTTV